MMLSKARWFSPDALGGNVADPQSLNRYAYVLNSPTTLTDPSGLCGEPDSSYIDSNGVVQVTGSEPCWWQIFGLGFCTLTDGYGCGYNGPNANVYPSGGGNTGGGSNSPPPKPAPAPPGLQVSTTKLIVDVNRCAAQKADSVSAASLLHLNNNRFTNALLGSSTASASRLVFGTNPNQYVPEGLSLVGGTKAGTALTATVQTAGRIEVGQGFQSVFTTVAPTSFGQTVAGQFLSHGAALTANILDVFGKGLFIYDATAYVGSLIACTQ